MWRVPKQKVRMEIGRETETDGLIERRRREGKIREGGRRGRGRCIGRYKKKKKNRAKNNGEEERECYIPRLFPPPIIVFYMNNPIIDTSLSRKTNTSIPTQTTKARRKIKIIRSSHRSKNCTQHIPRLLRASSPQQWHLTPHAIAPRVFLCTN